MAAIKYLAAVFSFTCLVSAQDYRFSSDFKFGIASSAYQVEGAWNVSGKGENIWDRITHTYPDYVLDSSNADDACLSYYKIKEDVQLLKDLGVNYYRFSISWSRLLPTGHSYYLNDDGIRYYLELIDELLANGINPIVTMFHWDLPYPLHELGGWPNPLLDDYFVEYAKKLFEIFGEKVKYWITFNEPFQFCNNGYGSGELAPGYVQDGIGNYLCGHTVLLAHAKTFEAYNKEFRPSQHGQIGISLDTLWYEPATNSREDLQAATNKIQSVLGWFAHPIFSREGDYPSTMRERIDKLSLEEEGYRRTRLPKFSPEEIELVKGSSDFFGLSHYWTETCQSAPEFLYESTSYLKDSAAFCYSPLDPNAAWGLRKLLNWIKTEYDNPPVFISGNGVSDNTGKLNDCDRVDYFNKYLEQVLLAIVEDNCMVISYTAWSLLDNFEWRSGYTSKYGLHYVDFDNPDRPRIPKRSAKVYANIIRTKTIDLDYTPEGFQACNREYIFPPNFKFGVATGAYQVEGAWNVEGKGENIWDFLVHNRPNLIVDGSNGDIACDTYHKTAEDVQILSDLRVDVYRFSISWSRLLPGGHANYTNPDGVRYYNGLINALMSRGIRPMITLYHWDLPQPLQEIGGWPNPYIADIFADYADVVFSLFGDRVTDWITFNEPYHVCVDGYSTGVMAPAYTQDGVGGYLCGHTVLLAHAKAYRLYQERYKPSQNGRIGIAMHGVWGEPETDSAEDRLSADAYQRMHFGWFAHPIFSQNGDYAQIMKDTIRDKSAAQGFSKSRLPEFTNEEIELIRGTADFLGLNHYTSTLCSGLDQHTDENPSHINDRIGICVQPSEWDGGASPWLKVAPWGFRKMLNWIKEEYDNPQVIITENGYSDTGDLRDCARIRYINEYLGALLEAMYEDECNVIGYIAWSFLDTFEWFQGYTTRFGLYHVDFSNPSRPRTPKMSSHVYRHIIDTRKLDSSFTPEGFEACQ